MIVNLFSVLIFFNFVTGDWRIEWRTWRISVYEVVRNSHGN